jgi:hypothetical protein
MPRKYTKKSEYWNQPRTALAASPEVPSESMRREVIVNPTFDESNHYTAIAACGGGNVSSTSTRNTVGPEVLDKTQYKNIRSGLVPFFGGRDGYYSVGEAISLVYQAYFNVAVIRNSINMLQDFSVSPLKIRTSNKTVKKFFDTWFEAIKLSDFMSQYFLEYYRSGNVFIYKFNGKIPESKFDTMKQTMGAKSSEIPVRYIILNPMQVYLQMGPTYNYNFVRMLSTYEITRLKNPQTEEDKAVLKSFPKEIQQQIKNYNSFQYLYVPLDTKRLYYVFNRKQDYEPLAVPPVYPVLNDVELKLNMKRIDASLLAMMENVVLLVTTGDRADQYNVGLNPRNLETLSQIFKNQTIGRVLVADYTTKLEWKIPDITKLIGEEKYKRVDADIKEGLQNILFGDEKFANASIKAKIFIEGLKEGRRAFLDNFLRPEVKKICKQMNFKQVPELEFEEINIQDPSALQKIYYQMAQLGLLTNTELNEALTTGLLPDAEESETNQKKYKKDRDAGLYAPLAPKSEEDGGMGRPDGSGSPISNKAPIGTSKAGMISQLQIVDNIPLMNALDKKVSDAYKKKYKLKKLTEGQQTVATAVAKSIILNEPKENWEKSIDAYVEAPKDVPSQVRLEVDEIFANYNCKDDWEAIVLYLSKIKE